MNKLFLFIFLLIAANAQAATITDNFTRGNNTDLGANWDSSPDGACQIVSNQVEAPAASSICGETWNANSFTDNQWAQITIANFISASTAQAALLIRYSAPPTETGYRISARHNYAESTKIIRYNDGVGTTIGSENAVTWGNGDIFYVEISGATLTVKRNSTTILQVTDSSPVASGRIGLSVVEGGTLGDTIIDSFTGGDLTAPVGGTARRVVVITQ